MGTWEVIICVAGKSSIAPISFAWPIFLVGLPLLVAVYLIMRLEDVAKLGERHRK